jgi:hypothetical protein
MFMLVHTLCYYVVQQQYNPCLDAQCGEVQDSAAMEECTVQLYRLLMHGCGPACSGAASAAGGRPMVPVFRGAIPHMPRGQSVRC